MTPEGWRNLTLKDVAPGEDGLQTGPFGAQLHASDYAETGVPVVMPKDLDGGRIVTRTIARVPEAIATSLERHRVLPGDILFGRRGDIGRCGRVVEEEQGWLCGTGCLRARPDTRSTVSAFMAYLIASEASVKWLTENAVGQTMLNLNTSILGRLPVLLPPLSEQRRIAAILSSVDEAIEATQAVIDQLQVVKKAMMAELLTRGLPGRHTRFKQTEIGEVPEGWEVLPIERVIDFCDYGLSKSLSVQRAGVAVLRMGNLAGGHVVLDDLKYINGSDVSAELLLVPGDVLFNRTNSKDLVGKVGVFGGAPFNVSFASYLLRLRPCAPHSGDWLGAVMNLESNQTALRAMATPGVSQVNINRGKMVAMKVPVPPPDEQRDLMAKLSGLDERLAAERVVVSQIGKLKSALLSVLLTGEVRVKPDEEAA